MLNSETEGRRVVFQFLVPVVVEVDAGTVTYVVVVDDTPIKDPVVVEGDEAYLTEAIEAANNGQPWPSWQFGY